MRAVVPVVCALGLVSGGCVDIISADLQKYVVRDEKRFTVSGRPEVQLTTFDGSIEVRPWDKPEVEVIIEKRGTDKAAVDRLEVQASQSGQRITVEVKSPSRHVGGLHIGFNSSPSAKLIVSLPASSDVIAKSGDGSIQLERVTGKISLHSGDGSIRARDVTGDVSVETGDGSIAVDGQLKALRARSGDGSVRIQAASGSAPSSDWDINTGDGSVTLELPDPFNCELDAYTGDGGIRIRDITVSDVSGEIKRNSVRGRLGSGGPTVRIRTGDGSITLRRLAN